MVVTNLFQILRFLLYLIILQSLIGCAGDQTRTWHDKAEIQYYKINEEKLFVTNISYGGKDAELIVTERAVYVLYGKDDDYLNPAYECPYISFGREVVEKADKIGINCIDGINNKIHYFHIRDPISRASASTAIAEQSLNAHVQGKTHKGRKSLTNIYNSRAQQQKYVTHDAFKSIAISSPNTCIPNETLDKVEKNNGDFHPLMLAHPEVAPYTYFFIANPVALLGAGLGLALESAIPHRTKDSEYLTTHTSLVGASTDFNITLATTTKSILGNEVALISKLCNASVDDEVVDKAELKNKVETIIQVNSLSGKLLGFNSSASEDYDTELWMFCSYNIINAENGSIVNKGNVRYVDSNPLIISDKSKINDDSVQDALRDAYHDMSVLIIDNLLNYE